MTNPNKQNHHFDGSSIVADIIEGVFGFFNGKMTREFSEYQDKNKLHVLILAATIAIAGLIDGLIPQNIDLTMVGLRPTIFGTTTQNGEITFLDNLTLKAPFLVFAVYSIISFMMLYNRYVSVIHNKIVSRTKLPVILAIFGCLLFIYLSTLYTPFRHLLLVISASYFFAFLFTLTLRSYLAQARDRCVKNNLQPGSMRFINAATKGWVYVNLTVSLYWMAFYFIYPFDNLLLSDDPSLIILKFSWLIIALTITGIIVSGARGGPFSYGSAYYKEVRRLNAEYQKALTNNGNGNGQPGGGDQVVTNNDGNMNASFKWISGAAKTTRLAGSLAASWLIYLSGSSIEFAAICLSFLLFSFAFNDYIDHIKDVVGHPTRAIPSGQFSRKSALFLSIFLALLGLALVAIYEESRVILFLFLYSGSATYSFALKNYVPSIATPLWSVLISALLVAGLNLTPLQGVSVFLFFYGRELLLDYRDIRSDDMYCRTRSLASVLGRYSFIVASLLTLASASVMLATNTNPVVVLFLIAISTLLLHKFLKLKNSDANTASVFIYEKLMLVGFPLLIVI